jgi:DNA adenine methylase
MMGHNAGRGSNDLILEMVLSDCDLVPDERALPIVKWAGGKRAIIPRLMQLAPRRLGRYFEPFLGGASVFLALGPERAVLGDANCDLMELYRAIRDEPHEVMCALDRRQPFVLDAPYFYAERATLPASLTPAERAARFIYLNKTCYNGLYRVNRAGQFNVPFGRYTSPPLLYRRENIERVSDLLCGADLRCGDFAAVVAEAGPGDFVYLDPPYVPLTDTANFTKYTSGSFGLADQRRLADTVHELHERGCKVLLSNSDTPLVRELYARYEMDVIYAPRQINSDVTGRSKIAELAIRTYPLE